MNKTLEEKRRLGAFYTKSDIITKYVVQRLELKNGFTILEPSAGDGEFIDCLLKQNIAVDITAFDVDPECVEHLKAKFPSVSIQLKNTIMDNVNGGLKNFTEEKWDRIFGNPPYGAEFSDEEKKIYSKLYPEINVTESYALFLVNCINRLNEEGILSFIISDTFLHLNTHDKLRKFILNRCLIREIVLLKTKLFPDVNYQYAGICIFTIQKCSDLEKRKSNLLRFVNRIGDIEILSKLTNSPVTEIPDFVDAELIHQSDYSHFVDNVFFQAGIPRRLLELFMDHTKLVGDFVQCKTGIYSGDNKRHFRILENTDETEKQVRAGYSVVTEKDIVRRLILDEEKKNGIKTKPCFVPLMKGGSGIYHKKPIWFIDWSADSLNYMLNDPKARVQNSEYYFRKGICMSLINSNRQQARIMEEVIFDQSDNGYFCDENYVYFFLGFFNSRLFNYLLKKVMNPTANATVNYVKKIPVILPSDLHIEKMKNLVKEIIEIKKNDDAADVSGIENSVDAFFYDLYSLDEAEKKKVNEFCYHLR